LKLKKLATDTHGQTQNRLPRLPSVGPALTRWVLDYRQKPQMQEWRTLTEHHPIERPAIALIPFLSSFIQIQPIHFAWFRCFNLCGRGIQNHKSLPVRKIQNFKLKGR